MFKNKLHFVFLLIMLFLTTNSFAQLTIHGLDVVCLGQVENYNLSGTVPGVAYSWVITSPDNTLGYTTTPQSMLNTTQISVQWTQVTTGYYTITVTGSDNSQCYLWVGVYNNPPPFITFNNQVACQIVLNKPRPDQPTDPNYSIADNTNGCVNVCENSQVVYYANGQPYSTYTWTVYGGVFASNGLTTITTTYASPNPPMPVNWGAMGTGTLTLTEVSLFGCDPKTVSICFNKIETPVANFTCDVQTFNGSCWEICNGTNVTFSDLSTAGSSQIINWDWDFGDGSAHFISQTQCPIAHIYNIPGHHDIILTVTNKCGCISTIKKCIEVKDDAGLKIYCPNVVCEGASVTYSTDKLCDKYKWDVVGGTPVSNVTTVEYTKVTWNNVGSTGFGTVTLSGINCPNVHCPFPITISVPVILTNGTIDGPLTTCVNNFYWYKLPAWPATDFTWTIGVGGVTNATIVSYDKNSHDVEINTGATTGTIVLNCSYYNTLLGCSGTATLTINVAPKPVIHPVAKHCTNTSVNTTLSINPTGNTLWTLVKPNGSIVNITTTSLNSISFNNTNFTIPGFYQIMASNPTFCDPDAVTFEVVDPPPQPAALNGETIVCPNVPYSYNVLYVGSFPPSSSIIPGTIVNWTITGGTPLTATGNSVNITWNTTGPYLISVTRSWDDIVPACTSSALTLNVNTIPLAGYITGPNPVIEDQSGTSYTATNTNNNSLIYDVYEWSLSNSALGSISYPVGSSPNNSHCNITWNHLISGSVSCTLICKVTKCGISTNLYFPITILVAPTYTITPSTQTICNGDQVTFNVSSSVGGYPLIGYTYTWDFGDNILISGTFSSNGNFAQPHTYNILPSANNSTLNVTLKITNGVTQTATATVIVHPTPTVNLSPGGTYTVCSTNPYSYTLSLAISTGATYQWYHNGPISQNNPFTINQNSTPLLDGTYYAVVTNSYGCHAQSNNFVLVYQNCDPPCTPVAPAGITNMNPVYITCASGQAVANVTSNVSGSLGAPPPTGNIYSYNWITPGGNGCSGIFGGTPVLNSSPQYVFTLPGNYYVEEDIYYADNTDVNNTCKVTNGTFITIPFIPDFKMYLQCNGTGYNLTLNDNTSSLPTLNPTSWTWTDNGNSFTNNTLQNTSISNISSGPHTIHLITSNGTWTCDITQTITVPAFPQASFTISTQDPCSSGTAIRSCEGMAVTYTNTSTVSSNIIDNVWDFGDNSSIHTSDINVYKSYNFTGNNNHASLTVTDKYGCTSTSSQQTIGIAQKSMHLHYSTPGLQYLPSSQIKCVGDVADPITPDVLGGNLSCQGGLNNITYQWYTGNTPYGTMQTTTSLSGITLNNIVTAGAYWVEIIDAEGCILDVNPTPATVNFKNNPLAIIEGKQDVCFQDNVKLTSSSDIVSNVTYEWTKYVGSGTGTVCGNTQSINLSSLQPNDYYFTFKVTDNGSTLCNTTTSAKYRVTVHAIPTPPTITILPIDCDTYHFQLTATSNLPPPIPPSTYQSSFTWSNGGSNATTDVYAGGDYRVWETDQFGCKTSADFKIPLTPSTYFWRFPLGCYTFCPKDLINKYIDGPDYILFKYWAWEDYTTGLPIPHNGSNPSYDYSIDCKPLTIDNPPNGSGSLPYQWELSNNYCSMKSGIMDVTILDKCCDLKIEKTTVICKDKQYLISITFNYTSPPGCTGAFYNLYCTPSLIPVISGALNNGINTVTFSIPVTGINSIDIKIEGICGLEKCLGFTTIDLPPCDNKSMLQNDEGERISTTKDNISWLKVVPNPANTDVTINYHFTDSQSGIIERTLLITDAVGRELIQQKISQTDGVYKLNVSQFGQGIYFVEILENNRHLKTERLVVHH